MKFLALFFIMFFCNIYLFSQDLQINADLRIRDEIRNGYGTLKPDTAQLSNFISQRTRLILNYTNKNLKLTLSPQNVRVWGDVNSLSKNDINNSMHEAFGEITFDKIWSLKIGRQELNYDDARILGNADWNMQARSHDVALLKLKLDSTNIIHLGLAYNAMAEGNFQQYYTIPQYKTMQFLWYHGDFKAFNLSILSLNNGVAFIKNNQEKIAYSQTNGAKLIFTKKAIKFDITSYYQTGKVADNEVNAWYGYANFEYKFNFNLKAGCGYEYLSGKSTNDTTSAIKSFNPLYGTHHKFNGFMDYFYVGNFLNSVGLSDLFLTLSYSKNKISSNISSHTYTSAAGIYQEGVLQPSYLGTEIDFSVQYQIFSDVKAELGYSQMFATNSMELIKGGDKSNANNWLYLMVKFNPTIFKTNAVK